MKKITTILSILVLTCSLYGQNTTPQPKQGGKEEKDKNKEKEEKRHHHPHHHDHKPGEKK